MLGEHTPDRQRRFSARAVEVVRVVDRHPHLLLRVTVSGGFFPQRSEPPAMSVAGPDEVEYESWFTEISNDGRAINAYFAVDLPETGRLRFGYVDRTMGALPWKQQGLKRLDRQLLAGDVQEVSRAYLRGKRGHE